MIDTAARLLTVHEAARVLNKSDYTVRKLAREGAVPCVKFRGGWRFPIDLADRVLRGESCIDRGTETGEGQV